MKKTRPMLRWAGILVLGAVISLNGGSAWADNAAMPTPASGKPDQITIKTLADFEKLELPPVTYFHDKHTHALAKDNKGCETCHYVEDNKLSLTFLRRKTTTPGEIKDIYHANCIGCHNQTAAAGKNSGPQDGFCRSCHNADARRPWPGSMPAWTRSCTTGIWTPKTSPPLGQDRITAMPATMTTTRPPKSSSTARVRKAVAAIAIWTSRSYASAACSRPPTSSACPATRIWPTRASKTSAHNL